MQQQNIRILAAIMFTDIVGYTALMQQDETNAKLIRDKHRAVLEKATLDHHGQIIQYYGDGTLTIFASAYEAVMCAIEIQSEFRKDPVIPIRVGLHLGDIVYEDQGAYGDGVNVASRMEALAVEGSILISDKVFDEVSNHPEIKTVSLGRYELKNVKRPVEVFAISNEGVVVPEPKDISIKQGRIKPSIAVLPFVNMSADKENEYFSDGITEEILNALAKVEELKVTARTSSFAFKGKNIDIREVASSLDVTHVLEGSVRKAGNRVRVTGQLIDASDGYHLWSETFDGDLEDIFEVQDEISRKIVDKLLSKLVKKDNRQLVRTLTGDLEAYNLFLKAQYSVNKWTPPETLKAIEMLEEVIKLAPDFSQAYSSLAGCYGFLGATGYMRPAEAYPKSEALVQKALELDDELPESYIALSMSKMLFDWDFQAGKLAVDKAYQLNPGNVEVLKMYYVYYTIVEERENALKAIEEACKLDPLSTQFKSFKAEALFNLGRMEEALNLIDEILENEPGFRQAIVLRGWIYIDQGKLQEAKKVFYGLQDIVGRDLKSYVQIGHLEGLLGNEKIAYECLAKLEEKQKESKKIGLYFDFAIVYAGLSDYDKMFEYLYKAYDERIGGLIFINRRFWKKIHKDERYLDLLRKMGRKV